MNMDAVTPFPSPVFSTTSLPSDSPSDASTASIHNAGTMFYALRRHSSYHAEVASAVASIFDPAPDTGHHSNQPLNSNVTAPRHNSHKCVTPCTFDSGNVDASHHLTIELDPLFEQVFLIRNKPRTSDGAETQLRCGAYICNNVDSYLWKICGAHISNQGRTVIYRACNQLLPISIFIASPIEWSTEGLEFHID
jgi:hypothetical protein